MKVLIVEPGKDPREEDIKNDLVALQEIVGGYIETVTLEDGVVAIVDEEGKLKRRTANKYIPHLHDMLVGTIVIAGMDAWEGEFTDLPEDMLEKYRNKWRRNPDGREH